MITSTVPRSPCPAAHPEAQAQAPLSLQRLLGPTDEVRRLSAGIRAIVAMLCTLLLSSGEPPIGLPAVIVLLGYDLWAACVLWAETRGRPLPHTLLHYWGDVAWTLAMLRMTSTGTEMLIVTLVQPVVLASIGYGVRHGLVLALLGAFGLAFDAGGSLLAGWHPGGRDVWPAVAVLALVPAAALLSRPLNMMRRRHVLVHSIEARLDPRRGLMAVSLTLVEALRRGTGADIAALVLPASAEAPAVVCTGEGRSFRASSGAHAQLEAVLDALPACALTYAVPSWGGLRGGLRVLGACGQAKVLRVRLAQLATLLEVSAISVVPLERYGRRHGCLLLGTHARQPRVHDVAMLADAAPDLFRVVEQAALVDQLQAESAAHERACIGRDLHDSAIQPYVGLKFAVEGVAAGIGADNPARPQILGLVDLVQHEVKSLRELISGLRVGQTAGDNALVPAIRRQVQRFATLFGIEVRLECPHEVPIGRTLAGSVFHMVNETLNNVRQHTDARRVWITLAHEGATLRLSVRDDGGVSLGHAVPAFHPRSLNERAAALGGSVEIRHPEGVFTEVVITLPLLHSRVA